MLRAMLRRENLDNMGWRRFRNANGLHCMRPLRCHRGHRICHSNWCDPCPDQRKDNLAIGWGCENGADSLPWCQIVCWNRRWWCDDLPCGVVCSWRLWPSTTVVVRHRSVATGSMRPVVNCPTDFGTHRSSSISTIASISAADILFSVEMKRTILMH